MAGSKKGGSAYPAVKPKDSENSAQEAKNSDQSARSMQETYEEVKARWGNDKANRAAKRPADPTPVMNPSPAKRANTNSVLQARVEIVGLPDAVRDQVCEELPDLLNEELRKQLPGLLQDLLPKVLGDQAPKSEGL